MDVTTFGEPLVSFVAEASGSLETSRRFLRSVGGAETNVAIGLARLGHAVGLVSRVGRDPFGRHIVSVLEHNGVDIAMFEYDETFPTGIQFKSRLDDGESEIYYMRRGSAVLGLEFKSVHADYFGRSRHAHLTGIPLAFSASLRTFSREVLGTMRRNGKTSSFDPNLRPRLWTSQAEMIECTNQIACAANWVLPGLEEGRILTGYHEPNDIAAFYLDRGVDLVVIKLGPDGAFFRDSGDDRGMVASYSIQPVDTVGAGDAFAAGLISGFLEGIGTKKAIERGNAAGALTVMLKEDFGTSSLEELTQFMASYQVS